MASVFLPSSASWVVVFVFNLSTLISSRRVDMANSARSWSLSARISAIESGVEASSRFIVSRTARLWTRGTNNRPSKAATKNPIPKYMTDSIMTLRLEPLGLHKMAVNHAMRARIAPPGADFNLNRVCPPRHLFDRLRRRVYGIARLERIPRRPIGEFEVAEISPEAEADAGADRDDGDVVSHQRGHTEAADEIGGAVDTAEPLENRIGARKVVHQHHRARAVRAGIKTDSRSLPEHAQVADILRIKRAVAVAQTANKGAARFFAQNIAVWLSPATDRLFHDHGEPAGHTAKEPMAGVDQFIGRELIARLRRRGRGDGRWRLRRDCLSRRRPDEKRSGEHCRDGRQPRRSSARSSSESHGEVPWSLIAWSLIP